MLNQNFNVSKPYEVWVTDISYIPTEEGWLYLAIVKDLFNKEIVGWSTDKFITKELTIHALRNALRNAIRKHRPPKGLIHHSDRGVQYYIKDYQSLLKKHHIECSMSRKGNCYDNACAETFFSTIKTESIHLRKLKTRKEARNVIFEYIEIFYNRKRRHAALDYMTPAEFTRKYKQSLAA